MDQDEARHDDHSTEEPDDEVAAYENDDAENRESLEREAGLTSFGGPTFGHLFDRHPDDGGFNAQNNP
ncbi:hypothetical protein [Leifsonia shinshuensis]|jgi:hypothetical protein|uniref:hypothetical protein n=1 Tax=Leifsonia TaxID=110932 RepID=UPI002855DD5A|nr:hypothetical protein [Leifsonia shinshuensis]MDR6970492.1 hypothetical protein [Leifsonia shinshuensis]